MISKVINFFTASKEKGTVVRRPKISIVVIVYKMAAQAENTVKSMLTDYQLEVVPHEYEVIIVENESPDLMRPEFIRALPENFNYYLRKDAESSPGPAVNYGAGKATGENICVLIDGARMLTPGAIKNMLLGHRLGESSVVSISGYHLGNEVQQEAVNSGYGYECERELLDSISWPDDGYRLFEISCLNASTRQGFFMPISESNCISIPRPIWDDLGGYDTRFDLRGGGLVNLDFYKRACEYPGAVHVILPGEGTFHQFHGGVTTGGQSSVDRSAYIEASYKQYRQLKGEDYTCPDTTPIFLGEVPSQSQRFVVYSAQMAMQSGELE
jgi:glycosyltransferase involved in cell wall biosynthesis